MHARFDGKLYLMKFSPFTQVRNQWGFLLFMSLKQRWYCYSRSAIKTGGRNIADKLNRMKDKHKNEIQFYAVPSTDDSDFFFMHNCRRSSLVTHFYFDSPRNLPRFHSFIHSHSQRNLIKTWFMSLVRRRKKTMGAATAEYTATRQNHIRRFRERKKERKRGEGKGVK